MKNLKSTLVVAFIALFSNGVFAQVDAIDKSGLAIGGYDVVSYQKDHKAMKGTANFAEQNEKVTYYFTSKENAKAFKANPKKYLPQVNGYCAWGVAEKDSKFSINPETFKVVDNKLYLFFNGDINGAKVNTLDIWNKDESKYLSAIDSKWAAIK
ncbi:YHS domain-containing protein [Flavobacterium sp. 7E]|uniref:YHS domain-containing (seleno)protein n=1 Tax=unclassified Flavobacterium TaxID=196869 RepID=UPI001C2CF3EA|nr:MULTISPECIES: YHS domain-containing (seleno)protein [unclassified Flavobacterium]NRS87191.1 YHS domain-containing protein [Flavobacterium sp. 7E]NRT11612.1 YHS domain-containing protein [Flavobacterium sp. 14A]